MSPELVLVRQTGLSVAGFELFQSFDGLAKTLVVVECASIASGRRHKFAIGSLKLYQVARGE